MGRRKKFGYQYQNSVYRPLPLCQPARSLARSSSRVGKWFQLSFVRAKQPPQDRVLLVSLGPLRNFESLPPVRLTAIFVFLNHSCSFPSRKEDREREGSAFADRPLSLFDFPVFFAFVKTVFSRLKEGLKFILAVESKIFLNIKFKSIGKNLQGKLTIYI